MHELANENNGRQWAGAGIGEILRTLREQPVAGDG